VFGGQIDVKKSQAPRIKLRPSALGLKFKKIAIKIFFPKFFLGKISFSGLKRENVIN